ncbi:hypothetical protein [Thiohalorhabdus methylotrophus]|uniref:Cellulose biosynthesis protein BcsS n=1 Tax=Thiohalorhabdus methylotrophus TaxID=3242694 RepID=A0ABV4TRP0_9GAMM
MRRALFRAFWSLAGLAASGPALSYGTQFILAPPPLGHPVYRDGQVQYRVSGGLRGYSSEETDLTGATLSLSRRQALSDRLAFNLGGQADYLSGTDRIFSDDNDLTVWQTMLHLTGEVQHRFAPGWNAIFFAGPKGGYGEYRVEYGERLEGRETLYGYVVGVQSSVRVDSLRVTPFLSYEALESRRNEDFSTGTSRAIDRTHRITQYGLEVLFRSGLTLGVTRQHWSSGSEEARYTFYQAGYQF